MLAGSYVQVDETPIDYLDPGGGQTGQGYLWVCAAPRGDVVFHWATNQTTECLAEVLSVDFTGTMQCDGCPSRLRPPTSQATHLGRLLGQAINYALGQWPTLTVYLGGGRLDIDNHRVENAIRPTALGKKNWLFGGADTAGDRSTVLYTIIESRRRHGLDPYAYLCDILTRLPVLPHHQVPEITPANWGEARPGPRSLAA